MIMKPAAAAAMMGVHKTTFVAWCSSAMIPGAFRTLGNKGHWRIDEPVFSAWLSQIKSGSIEIKKPSKKRQRPPSRQGEICLRDKLSAMRASP